MEREKFYLGSEVKRALSVDGDGWLVLVTVGNILRSDDGVGPYIAARLKGRKNLYLLDGGICLERFSLKKLAPRKVQRLTIVDAVDFRGKPGEIRSFTREEVTEVCFTTHQLPLTWLVHSLKRTRSFPVHFLGIQPAILSVGQELSPPVRRAAEKIIWFLKRKFPPQEAEENLCKTEEAHL